MTLKHLLLLLTWGLITVGFAQDIEFSNAVPSNVHSCADAETFTVEFTNSSGANISNISIEVNLPTGISYVGNLVETSNYNIQELSIADPTAITFSSNDLPDRETISFTFDAIAGFDAIAFQQGGNVFRNRVIVNYNSGSTETTQTNAYNVYISALSITSVNNMIQNASNGEVFTRTTTIFNGGFGKLGGFILKDINDGGLALLSTNIGTIDASNTEISIDATAIQTVGNGDIWLDQNESIVITETLRMENCADSQSELYAFWGCDGQTSESNKKYPKTTVTLLTPDLVIEPIVEFEPCIVSNPDLQKLSITNNGTGAAQNVKLDVFQYAGSESYKDIFSKIDVDNITYTIDGGSPIPLTPDQTFDTNNSGPYACLGNTAKGRFLATLPTIEAGQTLVLTWESLTCATDYCGRVDLVGWRYKVDYEDVCLGTEFTDKGIGQEHRYKDLDLFVESPVDILDGEPALFTYVLSAVDFNLQSYEESYLELNITVPSGLSWSGNQSDLSFVDGATVWEPSNITFNGTDLVARYDFPIPFNLNRSEFRLLLTGDCSSAGTGSQDVGMELIYVMDASCSNPYRVTMTCADDINTYMHCKGDCNWGMRFDEFDVARTSFGKPDNNLDGLPDEAGSLDFNYIKTNRVMVGDTFETKFVGEVNGADWYSWNWGYANSYLPNGEYLKLLDVSVEVFDASTNNTLVCDNVAFSTELDNTILATSFDFSSATLAANACSDFNGFTFNTGDKVTLRPRYKVVGNIGPRVEQVTISNSFYMAAVQNPPVDQRYQCDTWYGNLTMIGYEFSFSNGGNQYNATNETPTTSGINAASPARGTGNLLREWWTGINGVLIENLTSNPNYPNNPSGREQIAGFEAPSNSADNYGTRIRGYIHVPTTGEYTFWISGDDQSFLYLGTDENPSSASRIAYLDLYTQQREWDKYPSQQSTTINLVAGRRYYVEVLHKEGELGDNLAVAWQGPGIPQSILEGQYISPFEDGNPNDENIISGGGTLNREWWNGINGFSINDLTSNVNFPNNPSGVEQITSFNAPSNVGDSYGSKISGYIYAPTTGDYTFWVAGDDHASLFLSTDEDPSNASRIAYYEGYTFHGQWDKYTTQQSATISLVAGQRYYVELLHKEGLGGDHVAVAWEGPNISRSIIEGQYLFSSIEENSTDGNTNTTTNNIDTTIVEIDPIIINGTPRPYTANNCNKTLRQTFRLRIGDYYQDDLFPREYRNWGNINNLQVQIPDGYTVNEMTFSQHRTQYTNSTIEELEASIVPISTSGNTFVFDLSQYYTSNGGNINLSDEGFSGTIELRVQPDCNLDQGVFMPINWDANFMMNEFVLGGGTTNDFEVSDRIRYFRADLDVSTDIQTQDGIAQTVSWNVTVNNTSTRSNAPKSWLYLNSPSDDIEIVEVVENATGTVLPKVGEFYRLGVIKKNSSEGFTVSAKYNRCIVDELIIRAGYSCGSYPNDFSEVECDYYNSNYSVFVSPLPAEMQAKVKRVSDDSEICGATVSTALEVLSAKIGYIKDVVVTIEVPGSNSIIIDGNTSQIAYPISDGFSDIAEPVRSGNTYTYEINYYNRTIADEGLVGITDINANKFQLYFDLELQPNYKVGEKVIIRVDAKRTCGDVLPTMVFNYDPLALFTKFRDIGLEGDEDNRGMAWGDYDGDDYPDLFITNYNLNEPNSLYHNNGNGTFTKITTGPIATDQASSIASSWADYDNDGDLDLYVTNNIGTKNFLYRNNGDGTFVSVQNDPVVNYLGYSHGVAWGDYDNDGYVDLFVTDFFATKFSKLYHNNGDGTFEENTTSAVTLDANSSTTASWVDYDNDGDQDLFVTNYNNENNALYNNVGNGNFNKVTVGDIVNDGGQSTGASWGDINNDGYIDLFVANAGNQNNFLYINNGDGTFTKERSGDIVTTGGHTHGSAFADYDNDGDLDLTVSNDSDTDNALYANNGDGTFTTIDNEVTSNGGNSSGVAWADFDLDGDLDIFTVNHSGGENFFFNNDRGSCNQDACLILVGTNSNASGLGAKISLKANIFGKEVWQTKVVQSQTGGGLGGQNELKQHFGLGDAAVIDSIVVEWPSGYTQYIENERPGDCITIIEEDGSIVCGKAFYDINNNCQLDADEAVIPNTQLLIQPGDKYVITDEDGEYSINLPAGNYLITEVKQSNWAVECDDMKAGLGIRVETAGERYCGNDFAFQPSTACVGLPDLEMNLATTALRVGFQSLYAINVTNNGTAAAEDIDLAVDFGRDIKPLESSIPWDSNESSTYYWNIANLSIGQSITIYVEDSVAIQAVIGDSITVTGKVSAGNGECNEDDNIYNDRNIYVGAIDPNDIAVNPEGRIRKEQELTYKIRFQNVGNASVRTVILRDELPKSLDIESLILGSSSHPYKFTIEDDHTIVWEFENINLPDSIANEPESHGFVTFKITPRQDTDNGTTIRNTAAIYFDNLDPVITNTVANIVYDKVNGERGTLMIFPNPMSSISTIQIIPKDVINGKAVDIQSIYIYDYLGRLVIHERQIDDLQHQLENVGLTNGYYLVRAIGTDGNEYIGKLSVKDTY